MAAFDPWEQALISEGIIGTPLEKLAMITRGYESNGRANAVSNRGARGSMQVMPGTFSDMADPGWDINNSYHADRAGLRYLKKGWEASGQDPFLASVHYYGGPGGMAKAKQGIPVYDPKNPNYPNTIEYGQRSADDYGASGMNTNFPNYLSGLQRTMPAIYEQLAGLVQNPQIDPALVQGIAEKRQANINMLPLAVGAMLSGDKGIRGFGQEMYKRGEDARNLVPIGDEGFVDPESAKFLKSPVGDERRALTLATAAQGSQDALAKVGANQEIALATLENNEWYRKNQIQLERMGVDIRDMTARLTLMQKMADPAFRYYMESQGLDMTGLKGFGGLQQGAPSQAAPMAPQGAPTAPQGAPMPAPQGAPGASIMNQQAPTAFPLTLGQQQPQMGAQTAAPQPDQAQAGLVPIPGANPVSMLPGGQFFGTDPVSGKKVFELNNVYHVFNEGANKYIPIQPPTFKNNSQLESEAKAFDAQRGMNDAVKWQEANAQDPQSPYINYEHFMKTSPAQSEGARKLFDERSSDIQSGRQVNALLQEFQQLNAKDQTGGPLDRMFPESNVVQAFSPDSQRMQAIAAEVKASSVPKNQGAVSDAERRLFGASVPGLQYDREVNNAIIGMYQLRLRYREDAAQLEQEFFNKYKHTNGMLQTVAKQLEAKYESDSDYQRLRTMIPGTAMSGAGAGEGGSQTAKPRFTIEMD